MSLEQANRYYELAARARQNGRNAIADALLRQAEREKEKAAMDVQDVADIQRERANAQQNIAQPQQNVAQQQAPVQETPAVETPTAQYAQQAQAPAQPTYQPSAEEMQNMADSDMYNVANPVVDEKPVQNNVYPGMDNEGDVIASAPQLQEPNNYGIGGSFDAGSPKIYDPELFAGAPPEGDEVWNTPEEQNARLLAQKKKQQEIEELARQAQAAKIGEQYWGNNRVY